MKACSMIDTTTMMPMVIGIASAGAVRLRVA